MSIFDFQQLIYIVLAPACGVFLVILLTRVVPNLKDARNRAFLALALADMGWLICNWLEALWPTREGTKLLMQSAYIFIAALPVAWLEYSLRVAGKVKTPTALRLSALLIIPAITVALAFSNDSHLMLWSQLRFTSVLGLPYLNTSFGPWFWVHAGYSYALVSIGAVLILDAYRGLASSLKKQAWLSLVAVLLPVAYNVAYVTGFLSFIKKDYTSIIFAVSAALFSLASDRYGLFSIVPIARSTLFDSLKTAVFVLSEQGRILDANASAKELLKGENPVGTLAGAHKLLELVAKSLEKKGPWEADIAIDTVFGRRPYELSCLPIKDSRGRRIGIIASYHDVAVRYELIKETSSLVSASMKDPLSGTDRNLPLCSSCGKARGRDGRWAPLPQVLQERYGIMATHGLCQECLPRYTGEQTLAINPEEKNHA
jgi:PAS domain-containing protein